MTTVLSGRRLAWHSLLNLAGQGLPVIAALVSVPVLVARMGTERFGILTLVWAVVGYFGLFDLGLGRALTQLVADRRHRTTEREIAALVWKAMLTMAGVGVVGCVLVEIFAGWLTRILNVTPTLQGEATMAFRIMAALIPVIVVMTGLRGVLEAYQRFDLVNAARVPLGALNYLAPLAVVMYSRSLVPVVIVLAVVRVIAAAVNAWMCVVVMPVLGSGPDWQMRLPKDLVRMGGWMTISNITSPLLVMSDRFLIGALVAASVVAYYTAPFEMVIKLTIIAAAVANSLFPAFASSGGEHERSRLYVRGLVMTCIALFPALIAVLAFAPELLRLWIGPTFATQSALILRVLALGVYVNCLTQIAFTLIQGAGRSDISAILHVAEVPVYLVVAWLLIRSRGVEGAAYAWSLRVTVDGIAMFAVAARLEPQSAGHEYRPAWMLIGLSVMWTVVAMAFNETALWQRAAFAFVSTVTVLSFGWFRVTSTAERQRLRSLLVRAS